MADDNSTRERIVAAATAEFSAYGIAGARMERIAKAARTSKERVYAYFPGKAELYRYVAAHQLTAMGEAVPLDPADLPGYATRLHDHALQYPEQLRLMRWGQLEFDDDDAPAEDPFAAVVARKVQLLRQAQADGLLTTEWEPEDIMVFVTQLATSWAGQTLSLSDRERDAFLKARRDAIERAVQSLFPAERR